jgi:capsular polysaccharide biosynthesis protein
MSQQALDLRRSVQIVRRHRRFVLVMALVGILFGCAYSVLNPPMLTATTLVVFPQSIQSSNAAAASATNGGPDTFTSTLVVIAGSNQVLAAALPNVHPAKSLQELRRTLNITSVTGNIISVSAEAKEAADAEATANAIAASYIKYVDVPSSPIGNQSATILQAATSASGTAPVEALIVTGFLGGLAGALIGVIVSLAISRRDRRLRARDEIANSVGLPVLASFPVARPSDAAGWSRLLQEYKPGAVHSLRLRTALRRVGVPDDVLNNDHDGDASSLTVLSLASDPGALALGPQLAVFAASVGIPTTLVIGPQQDEHAAATLRTACAVPLPTSQNGRGRLRIAVCDADDLDRLPSAMLTVVVAVVDGHTPRMPETLRTATTVLGVSAGVATAEQLARTAVTAAIDGREIVGLLVANPDPADTTTGQVPRLARPARHRMPTRMNGITTEIRR